MKLFVFLIFSGCAVKCDVQNNYYVIERPSEELLRGPKPFQVYWNVPTMQCRSKKIPFDGLDERFGIIQNKDDRFQGEQVTILYDPGLFPAILKEDNSGKLKFRNGGVPQEGNLDEHLTAFRYVLDQSIPDKEYQGIGIIDFESWRPVFRQNFGELTPYKNVSVLNERRLHPWWTRSRIEAEAKYRFERAGREFMQATASLARLLRPRARWGYYGFPYCFNMATNNLVESCPDKVKKENDQISWLWSESTALYPSVYSPQNLTTAQLASLIRGRVAEGARVSKDAPILPYFWFKYRNAGFMTEVDLNTAIKTLYKSNASGFIIWGSSNDVNTVAKCEKLKAYVEQILGPTIAKYTKTTYKVEEVYNIGDVNNTKSSNFTTSNPFDLITSDTKDDLNIQAVDANNSQDHDYGDENDTEDLSDKLADELIGTDKNNTNTDLEQNSGILIDILLSLIENVQNSENKELMKEEMVKINKDRKKGTPIHDTFTKVSNENDFDLSTKNPFVKNKKKGEIFTSLFTNEVTTELNNETTASDASSTTEYNYLSTTKTWDDNQTFYNEDTFFNQETNYTSLNYQVTERFGDSANDIQFNTEDTTANNYTNPMNASDVTTDINKTSTDINNPESTTESFFSTADGMSTVDMGVLNDTLSVASENNQVVISVV